MKEEGIIDLSNAVDQMNALVVRIFNIQNKVRGLKEHVKIHGWGDVSEEMFDTMAEEMALPFLTALWLDMFNQAKKIDSTLEQVPSESITAIKQYLARSKHKLNHPQEDE